MDSGRYSVSSEARSSLAWESSLFPAARRTFPTSGAVPAGTTAATAAFGPSNTTTFPTSSWGRSRTAARRSGVRRRPRAENTSWGTSRSIRKLWTSTLVRTAGEVWQKEGGHLWPAFAGRLSGEWSIGLELPRLPRSARPGRSSARGRSTGGRVGRAIRHRRLQALPRGRGRPRSPHGATGQRGTGLRHGREAGGYRQGGHRVGRTEVPSRDPVRDRRGEESRPGPSDHHVSPGGLPR